MEILRRAAMPIVIASSTIVTYMPSSSIVLSFSPNFSTAKFFSAGGVRSMNASPTAMIGDACGRKNAAARVDTPIATPAPRKPITALTIRPRASGAGPASGSALQGSGLHSWDSWLHSWRPASGSWFQPWASWSHACGSWFHACGSWFHCWGSSYPG
jgi:hypothetical protein